MLEIYYKTKRYCHRKEGHNLSRSYGKHDAAGGSKKNG